MTTLYIGSGQNRISAASALAQARPGDVLSFAQGSYDLGAITMIAGVSTHLTISDCRIAGDATASTMTVAIDGGTVVLNRVVIADDADLATV